MTPSTVWLLAMLGACPEAIAWARGRDPRSAMRDAQREWLEWLRHRVAGYGCGDGSWHGYGHGYGDGSGCGSGDGHGYGHGYGDGHGYGHGDVDGSGYGSGDGDGHGDVDGSGYGSGDGCGISILVDGRWWTSDEAAKLAEELLEES